MFPINKISYSQARHQIQVGDGFGFRSNKPIGWLIRKWRGGLYDFSHWATCVEAVSDHGRVSMFEFIGEGPRRSYLSEHYAKEHGRVFWVPMGYTAEQQAKLLGISAMLEENGTEYDFGSTWGAIIRPFIPMDAEKFNCSESGWFIGVFCGRLMKRFDKNGRQIAPVPGDFPVWAEATEIFEVDMQK